MLTQNEITSLSLSPTKKDFVQIWNELLEVAGKLSERWDPTSTNESDPGIVILKALAGIADKLNYNIDKNTLEAFMPTAAQEDSMRKLCDMLGYNIKYYQSAKVDVTIKYHNTDPSTEEAAALENGLLLPKFSVITNTDQDINYFTINDVPLYLSSTTPSIDVTCMEGQIVKCESLNENHIITANQISEGNRFYLPETQIAENGIFIYNVFNNSALTGSDELEDGTKWERVDNLNVQAHGSLVYKFGYDSYESRPYIEFPEDYGELFGDGIFIYYARTSGAAGNVSARTLTKLEFPSTGNWGDVASESVSVENAFSATTGANAETIKQAYNNFKKTIGTFETLVTCRDYMNKIYSMTNYLGKPYVSNVLVTDIRNDLNRAVTICSCDRAGIFYKETPLINRSEKTVDTAPEYIPSEINMPKLANEVYAKTINQETRYTNWYIGTEDDRMYLFVDEYDNNLVSDADYEYFMSSTEHEYHDEEGKEFHPELHQLGTVSPYNEFGERSTYWVIIQNGRRFVTKLPINWINIATKETRVDETLKINHFDLVLYPFKSYTQIKNNVKDVRSAYEASFKLNSGGSTFSDITTQLENENIKTVAHSIIEPKPGDIVSINNYLKLDATIATTSKITLEEGAIIIDKVKIALANAFNMRELDFGDEIPFESLVEVIENSDARIKVVSLNEPGLYTTFSVFEDYDINNVPIIKEYAVESDSLTFEQAKEADRFDIDKFTHDDEGNLVSLSTFNTEKARKYYNELVVRNILAGRVPLFDYNDTFDNSFSESSYQVTNAILIDPATCNLPVPDFDTPFTVCEYDNKTYSGKLSIVPNGSAELQYLADNDLLPAPSAAVPTTYYVDTANKVTYYCTRSAETGLLDYYKIEYFETFVPELFNNNVLTNIEDSNITDIKTDCKIFASAGKISDVTLASGEFVKFRAPNFTTIKTYPAYVNYHLALNKEVLSNAVNAEADSLFSILNSDKDAWTIDNKTNKWQEVINYFRAIDDLDGRNDETCYVKTASQTQSVSKYSPAASTGEDECPSSPNKQHEDDGTGKCLYCDTPMISPIQKGPIVVKIDDGDTADKKDLTDLLNKSGCLKFSDNHDITYNADTKAFEVKAILAWDVAENEGTPSAATPDLDLRVSLSSPFITDSSVLTEINNAVQTRLEEMIGQVKEDGSTPMLPMDYDWTITFEYECVPFEPASLNEWRNFIKTSKNKLVDYEPFEENGTIFWRVYGEGYNYGKYILQSSEKLLDFDRNYFGLLPDARLTGIYIIKNVGADAQAAIIANDEEYKLRANEYLYIEYTPSSTSDDGTTTESAAVTEILGPGTIIKPSGFEVGLQDSSVLYDSGTSYHKTVTFETSTSAAKQISMHKFNANEQVEVRDFAKVELKKDSFKSTPAIYYYKNFDCPALDESSYTDERKYTLKDGEYIFYTDSNKTELAYFTTGTEVSLEGSLILGKFDAIELSTIFDTGLSEIPWKFLGFSTSLDKLVFQEYQYITLGPEDTLNKLTLVGNTTGYLDSNWNYCDDVEYTLAGSEEVTKLSAVNTYDDRIELSKGCGWEVSSALELDVSYNAAQTLRKTPKIQTSLTLVGTSSTGGGGTSEVTITPEDEDHPLSFKTNLNCQTSSNHITIDDIYNNPKKLKGFEFKFFAKDAPAIVETLPGKVSPYDKTITDLTKWDGEPVGTSTSSTIWTEVALTKINVLDPEDTEAEKLCDRALRLPVSVLPNTYGVFTIYLDYTAAENAEAWIEAAPGIGKKDITIFNADENRIVWHQAPAGVKNGTNKLMLNPGVNCIRVNKTCRLFIKAAAAAQGAIFFDDYKLVNSAPIEYIFADGNGNEKNVPVSTYGLNIGQLGYLNPKDETTLEDILANDDKLYANKSITLEETLRETFKDSCVTDARNTLTEISNKNSGTIQTEYKELHKLSGKLETLKALLTSAKKELDTMKALTETKDGSGKNTDAIESLRDLFVKYTSLSEEIAREETLLKALNESKSLEALEGAFADLLASFEDVESVQSKLYEELEQLKTKAFAEIEEISDDTVISDFKSVLDATCGVDMTEGKKFLFGANTDNDFVKGLEKQNKLLIERAYETALTPLVVQINKVVNSEDRLNLLTILSSLSDASKTAARAELLTAIKQLIDTANSSELDSILDTILSAANGADFATLNATLTRLKSLLSDSSYESLLTELEAALNEDNIDYLTSLIEKLKTLAAGKTINADITKSIKNITDLIASKNLLTTEADSATRTNIANYAATLVANVNNSYKSDLSTVVTAAEEALSSLSSADATYSNALTSLNNSTNEQVTTILAAITELSTTRTNDLKTFDNQGVNAFRNSLKSKDTSITEMSDLTSLLPHGTEALLAAWRDEMESHLIETLQDTISSLGTSIDNIDSTSVTAKVVISDLDHLKTSCAALDAFATKVYEQALRQSQHNYHVNYLSGISLPEAAVLTDALGAISGSSSDTRNALIRTKIAAYNNANTASKKQTATKELKAALNANISALTPVSNAMVNILCPSVLLLEDKLPEAFDSDTVPADEFYKLWADKLVNVRSYLVEKAGNNDDDFYAAISLSCSGVTKVFNLLESFIGALTSAPNLTEWLGSATSSVNDIKVLLPTATKQKVETLQVCVNNINAVKSLLALDLKTVDIQNIIVVYGVGEEIAEVLRELKYDLVALDASDTVAAGSRDVYNLLVVERQLLADLRALDQDNIFYYTSPGDLSLAIEFNKSNSAKNTLLNPATNYDVNNVNNSFVISKLDIDYLDRGIQIARSSRLN